MAGTDIPSSLITDERYQRLVGVARSALWGIPEDIREDVIQDAVLRLEEVYAALREMRPGYVRKTLCRLAIDKLRRRGAKAHEIPEHLFLLESDEAHGPDAVLDMLAGRGQARMLDDQDPLGEDPPLCVIEKWLRILYAEQHSEPYELLVYAYWAQLGWQPAQIVETLGHLTLWEAARGFLDSYERDSAIPRKRLEPLFERLLVIRRLPEADNRLASYWDVLDVMHGWVDGVRSKVKAGAANPFADLVKMKEPANRRLAYLLHEWLRWQFHQIIARHGADTLREIAISFQGNYAENQGLTPEQVRVRFAGMLDCGDASGRLLNEYYSPARTITHWCEAVDRRLRSRLSAQEQRGLRTIFAATAWPYQVMAFLETSLLKTPAQDVSRLYGNMSLADWAALQSKRYGARRRAPADRVGVWFQPLREQILLLGDKKLKDCIESDRLAGQSDVEVVASWRSEVLSRIRPVFGCQDPETVIFAWRAGLLEAVNGPKRRSWRRAFV